MTPTTIFYFSGTGNSLAVSKSIAAKLGDTNIIPMTRENATKELHGSQIIGLVFPVYVFGLPFIVTQFIKSLFLTDKTRVFAVAVHGGMPLGTLKQAAQLFARQGMTLSAGYEVMMVDNYTPIAGAISPEKQKKRFEKAERKIEMICGAIKNEKRYIYSGWPLINWMFGKMYYGWIKKAASLDTNFKADSNCNGCGICQKVCPVGNIKMIDHLPAWQHHCEQCFACLHWCPNSAIQYGKHTSGRTRYHHPDIKMSEIIVNQ